MHTLTLLTGGSRSGKSAYALKLTEGYDRKTFIATAEPFDDEMRHRIEQHKKNRSGEFETVEEPIEIADAIQKAAAKTDVVLLDCLTVWIGNLRYRLSDANLEARHIARLMALLQPPPCDTILVTNEVGMGIVPENGESREFCDTAGFLNQRIAGIADRVFFLVCGLPISIKSPYQ